ncbi:MAG: tetratricopeptide repeat protein [Elainella sp.]
MQNEQTAFRDVSVGGNLTAGNIYQTIIHPGSASPDAVGIPQNLPLSGVKLFVGREAELAELHERLQQSERVAITAIRGMGGVGKTELAWQYAYHHLVQQTYGGGVGWFRAEATLGSAIEQFARAQLGLQPPESLELLARLAFCWRHWPAGEVLLILDDLTDYAAIQPFLPPPESRFKLLVTTRLRLGQPFQALELEVLSEAAALELLGSILADGRIEAEPAVAQDLCGWLGYLPLGIELVARYLEQKPDLSLGQMQTRLEGQRLAAKALQQSYPGMTAALGVAAAFELSWQSLSTSAQAVAHWLSLFGLAPIPWTLVQACLPDWDEETLEEARDELIRLHLLQRVAPNTYLLHQLLREFFAAKLSATDSAEPLQRGFALAMVELAKTIPQDVTLEVIARVKTAIPHLEAATRYAGLVDGEDWLWPYAGVASFYEAQSLWPQAEQWYGDCKTMSEARFGADHPHTAISLNNLAELYRAQGRYIEAELFCLQALEIWRSQLGAEHPNTAQSLNNLALLYESQGRYAEAEPFLLQALEIRRSQLGAEHPSTATSLNNLAVLYAYTQQFDRAEAMMVEALEIWRRVLGEQHPKTVGSRNSLAAIRAARGQG